jgi:hypothetical protein
VIELLRFANRQSRSDRNGGQPSIPCVSKILPSIGADREWHPNSCDGDDGTCVQALFPSSMTLRNSNIHPWYACNSKAATNAQSMDQRCGIFDRRMFYLLHEANEALGFSTERWLSPSSGVLVGGRCSS